MNNEVVKNFFNQVAEHYEHSDSLFIDQLLDSLHLKGYKRILDLGCGKGVISSKLATISGGEVTALDISSKMIEFAKKEHRDARVNFVQGDFYEYEDKPFDAIISFDCYPHFLDVDGFVKKANELLNKGGLLAIFHDIGRPALNEHHQRHAVVVSRLLKEPTEEVKPFLKYFKPIELFETDNCYKIILEKK